MVLRNVGNDHVIVDPEQNMVDMSRVFTLNEVAAELWAELKGKHFSINSLADLIWERYEVSYETAREDALKLIEKFEQNGLLTK